MPNIYKISKQKRKTEEEASVAVATALWTQKGSSPIKRFRCPKWKSDLISKLDNGNFSKWIHLLIDKELIANGLILNKNDYSNCTKQNVDEWL